MNLLLKKFWPFILIAVLSFALHFAFLSYPSQVVFDEVHFGKFVAAYFTGQYYFDIHPPLGKLLIAGFAKLSGVNPVFDFDHIGESASASMLAMMRFLPALFGSFFTILMAWFAWLLTRSKKTALIAGFLVLGENAILAQSRFILVDIFLLFFEITAFCFFLLALRQKPFGKKWFFYFVLTGLFLGLTLSVKWTGLATIGIFGAVLLAKIFSSRLRDYLENFSSVIPACAPPEDSAKRAKAGIHNFRHPELVSGSGFRVTRPPCFARRSGREPGMTKIIRESILSFIIILITGLLIYLVPFAIHFNLLQKSGPGDAFMSPAFQQELKNPDAAKKLGLWSKFGELNLAMWRANSGLSQTHPYGSRWFQWPLDQKPVFYWTQISNGQNYKIFLRGNFVLWLLGLAAILATLGTCFSKKLRAIFSKNLPLFFILIVSYLANFLPFIFIKRVAFLYHYLPALTFLLPLLAVWLAELWPKQKIILAMILFLIAANFLLFLPTTFGWPAV